MKKNILLCSLAVSSFLLHSNVYADDRGYVGLDFAISNTTELSAAGASIDKSNDLGFNLYSGHRFNISDGFDLGLELEYKKISKADFDGVFTTDADALFINGRSKFTFDSSNPLYSGILLGIGYIDHEVKMMGISDSESDIAYQAGLEVGYMLNNIDISIGYRWQFSSADVIDVTVSGLTAGLRYNF